MKIGADMIEIHQHSDAMDELRRVLDESGIHTLRILERSNGIAIKVNTGTWSPTLSTTARSADITQPSTYTECE